MRKTLTFILAVALSAGSFTSRAQDSQMANHLALGVTLGLDGIGIEAALPISPYVQAHAGYSIFPYTHKQDVNLGSVEVGGQVKNLDKTPLSATLWKGGSGKLLFDIFPGKTTPFHFTVGAYFGSGKFLHTQTDLSKVLNPADYATLAIAYNQLKISTDPKGFVDLDAKMKIGSVVPYVGVGFGRAIKPGSRVRVTFDMGVLITGGMKIQSYNYVNLEGKAEPVIVISKALTDENGRQLDNGWVDKIAGIPVLPMLKLNVFVRLF